MKQYTGFRFCPACASGSIEVFMNNAIKCGACGYVYFHDTAAAVAGILEADGKILLVKRGREPRAGFYDLPGGFVDYREKLEEALVREVREECGIEAGGLRYFGSFPNTYHYCGVNYFTADAIFLFTAADLSKLSVSNECSEFLLIEPAKIYMRQIAFPSIKAAVEEYQKRFVR